MNCPTSAPLTAKQQASDTFPRLTGAPAAILLRMLFLEYSTGRNELVALTGYHPQTVQKALEALAEAGLAQRFRRCNGWVLTEHARRLLSRAPQLRGGAPEGGEPLLAPVQVPGPVPCEPTGVQTAAADGGGGEAPPDAVNEPESAAAGTPSAAPDHPVHATTPEMQRVDLDGQQGDLRSCSSNISYSDHKENPVSKTKTTTTTTTTTTPRPPARQPASGEPSPEHAMPDRGPAEAVRLSWNQTADAAVLRLFGTGMPMRTRDGRGARDAVEAALMGGWTPDRVLAAVKRWFAYADSPMGATIKHKGFFTAAQLRRRADLPEVKRSREQRTRDYITERYRELYGRG